MSVRNGLVGSIASTTPSSFARVAAGAIRSQNSSAASSHVREPMLPVVHQTESVPTAAPKSSASPSTRSSVPMFDTRRPASANTAGSQPIASSFGEMAPIVGDAELAEEPELFRDRHRAGTLLVDGDARVRRHARRVPVSAGR